jgi:hypothetical protein
MQVSTIIGINRHVSINKSCVLVEEWFIIAYVSMAPSSIVPSALTKLYPKYPTAPAYTPRFSFSSSAINSIARTLGAPDTVPAGKTDLFSLSSANALLWHQKHDDAL